MPNVQPSYNQTLAVAIAGMRANLEPARVISREVELVGGIAYGAVVVRGTGDHQCKDATTGGTGYLGIALVDPTVPAENGDKYAQYNTCAIMVKGVIWVTVGVNVTPGQPAYFTSAGVITNVATSNTAIPNAVFDSTATSGGLAKLRMN